MSEHINEYGEVLTYGDYGRDTYGWHTTIDGKDIVGCVRAEGAEEAIRQSEELHRKFESGWRPVNW